MNAIPVRDPSTGLASTPQERIDGASRLYHLAHRIEGCRMPACQEAAREIALYALDLLAAARSDATDETAAATAAQVTDAA